MKKKKRQFLELKEKFKGKGVEPRCRHFGTCGGCMFQDVSYENQLLLKKEYINMLMEGIISIDEVHPANPFSYRNRMDMVTAFGKVGLREAGSYKFVADVESCEIMQEKSNSAYKKARPFLKEIEQYNYLRHTGYNRYIVIRQARFTGELMVNFVIAERENKLDELIKSLVDEVDSMSIIFNDGLADLSYGEVIENIKRGYIEESFDDIHYRVTPNSFFQSNSEIALEIYRKIKENTNGKVLDLYSGIGSISLYIADKAETVTGVEVVKESLEAAEQNRVLNNIENVNFICSDVKEFIKTDNGTYDTIILDPPRSGINPKAVKYINKIEPEKIIYMSCNPSTFRIDLEGLNNYSIEMLEAFDMFPQTPHIETLALLKRK